MTAVPPSVETVDFDSSSQAMRFHDVDVFAAVRKAGGLAWTEAAGGMWVAGRFDPSLRGSRLTIASSPARESAFRAAAHRGRRLSSTAALSTRLTAS